MFGRVPIRDVATLDDVIAIVDSGEDAQILIFDVDNTLAPQTATLSEFASIVDAAIDKVEAHPKVERVIALTNGPQRGVARMVSRGNKPWTTKRRLHIVRNGPPVVIIGDQVLTDGLLAWRFRATFLHLVLDDEQEDRRQANMRRIGGLLLRVLFRRVG
jgi:predicted HAD superfamily phosphohydrolase YqeG